MAVAIGWADEAQSIILIEFMGQWTWAEFHHADEQSRAMIRSIPHTINMMVDFTESTDLPNGALTELRTMIKRMEHRATDIIIVGSNMLIETTFQMFYKLYGKQAGFPEARFVKTRDEAFAEFGKS